MCIIPRCGGVDIYTNKISQHSNATVRYSYDTIEKTITVLLQWELFPCLSGKGWILKAQQ